MHANFSASDYTLLLVYVLASLSVGLWFSRSQKNIEGYFLAGRSAPSWVVAISLISSDTSAISYMGVAALVFAGDLQLFPSVLALPLGALFVAHAFVPFLAARRVFTIYEYLEYRFNRQVRTVASGLFILTRGTHLAVALYAAALALAQVMNLPVRASVLALGGITTVYTVLGGMKAVLWTDVIQFFVMMIGLVAVLVGVSIAFQWNFGEIWRVASHGPATALPWSAPGGPVNHTRMFNFSLSPYTMTFWAVMINAFIGFIGTYGSDQVLVQRYLAARSKREMAGSLIGASLLTFPVSVIFYATGVFLVAFYLHFLTAPGHPWVLGLTDANRVMTHFISNGLPGKLGATVIAGLFAGTMSSLSAGLNSLSTAAYMDFITQFGFTAANEKTNVFRAKLLTLGWGLLIIVLAGFIGQKDTVLAVAAKFMSPFAGPLLGLFLLGMLWPRANTFGAITGALAGAILTAYVTYFTAIHWLWYIVVGSVGGFLLGIAFSYLRPREMRRPAQASAGQSADRSLELET